MTRGGCGVELRQQHQSQCLGFTAIALEHDRAVEGAVAACMASFGLSFADATYGRSLRTPAPGERASGRHSPFGRYFVKTTMVTSAAW